MAQKVSKDDNRASSEVFPGHAARHALDTRETTATFRDQEGKLSTPARRKAWRKILTQAYTARLGHLSENTPLRRAYWSAYLCGDEVEVRDGVGVAKLCRRDRFCLQCAAVRQAKLAEGYLPVLEAMREPWFCTLTVRSVPAGWAREEAGEVEIRRRDSAAENAWRRLARKNGLKLEAGQLVRDEVTATIPGLLDALDQVEVVRTTSTRRVTWLRQLVQEMTANLRKVSLQMKRAGWPLVGIRKLEVTYNLSTGMYHPHFHLVVDGGLWTAETLVERWVSQWNGRADMDAQDYRPVGRANVDGDAKEQTTTAAMRELFKYFCKVVESGKGKRGGIDPASVDHIFQSIEGLRIVQPMGVKMHVPDEEDEIETKHGFDVPQAVAEGVYQWEKTAADWINQVTGEALSGLELDESQRTVLRRFSSGSS